jgi:LPS sulfotransferase NodH
MKDSGIRGETNLLGGFQHTFDELQACQPRNVSEIHILLSQPRTGSTLVSDCITRSGDLGWCDEWLNPIWVKLVARKTGAESLKENLRWTLSRASSERGAVTINLQMPHVVAWQERGVNLQDFAHRLVYLTRENLLEQALSLAKARKTNVYHSLQSQKEDDSVHIPESAIATALADIFSWHEVAENYIGSKDCLRCSYESVLRQPDTLSRIMRYFGSSAKCHAITESELRKQQTSADLQELRRFINRIGVPKFIKLGD